MGSADIPPIRPQGSRARAGSGKGRMRVTTQLEDIDPSLAPFLVALGVTG